MNQLTFNIGNQDITASYDDWEELFEELESIFGINAVENNEPEKEILTISTDPIFTVFDIGNN